MFDFLDNLRKKPAHVRRHIAIVISASFSLLVFSMWVGSWGARNGTESPETVSAKPPTEMLVSTLSDMKNEGVATWRETISLIQDATPQDLTAGAGNAEEMTEMTDLEDAIDVPEGGEENIPESTPAQAHDMNISEQQ